MGHSMARVMGSSGARLSGTPLTFSSLNLRSTAYAGRGSFPFSVHHIRDQGGQVPCCVSCSLATAMEALLSKEGDTTRLSPMYHYYYARNNQSSLSDLELNASAEIAYGMGLAPESVYPSVYTKEYATQRRFAPDSEADDAASLFRLAPGTTGGTWFQIISRSDPVDEWADALDQGRPIIATIQTTPSYWSLWYDDDGDDYPTLIPKGEMAQSYHTVAILGYEGSSEFGCRFRVYDSRGRGFAKDGMWWLSAHIAQTPFVEESLFISP